MALVFEAQAKTHTISRVLKRYQELLNQCYVTRVAVLQQLANLKALSCAVLCQCIMCHYRATETNAGCQASRRHVGRGTEAHLLSVGPMNMRQFLQSSMVTIAHASMTYRSQSCISQPHVEARTGCRHCRIVMPTAEQSDRIKSPNPRLCGSRWAVKCWHHRSFANC